MTARLAGKRCLIVGGTGGIGRVAAARFLEEGATLVVSGLEAPNEHPAHCITCDVSDADQVDRLFGETVAHLGGLDIVYHVAGISGRRFGDGPLHECSDDGWQTTIDVNLKGVFHTNRKALQYFLETEQPGVILNMASALAVSPSPHYFNTVAYTAAKGGVISMSRLAAASYAPHNIRINVIAPALIDTPMSHRACDDPNIRRFLETKQPLTRGPGSPEHCSAAAVFLCSDEARFITGAVVPVDGGWSVSEGQLPHTTE